MSSLATQLASILPDRRLIGLINELPENPNLFATMGPNAFCPITNVGSRQLKWRVRFAPSGRATAHHVDASVPPSDIRGFYSREADLPVYRKAYRLTESDITDIVNPNQLEGRYGMQIVSDTAGDANRIIDNSVEAAAWEALAGSLTVKYADGTSETVDYNMPAFLKPTASDWTQGAADIIGDIETWKQNMRRVGVQPGRAVFGQNVKKYIMTNTAIQNIIVNQFGERLFTSGELPSAVLGLPYDVYDQPYLNRAYVGTAYTTGTTLNVTNAAELGDLGSADKVVVGPSTHTANPGELEEVGVTSIDTGTGDITIDGAMTNDFAVGDPVSWYRPFLADDAFVILPQPDGQRWMEFAAAPSIHSGGAGLKYVVRTENQGVPFSVDIVAGIDGIPIIYRQMRHLYAEVGA